MHKTQNDRRELFIHHCEDIWWGGKCLAILLRLGLWHCYWPLLSCFCDKHHDQGNYRRKCLIGFAFSFRRLEFMMAEKRHGGRNSWELSSWLAKGGRKDTRQWHKSFETSKLEPSDTPPSTRSHLLILHNQFHQLATSIQTYNPWWPLTFKLRTTISRCPCLFVYLKESRNFWGIE